MTRRFPAGRVVVIVVVGLFSVWTLWPVYWMVSTSLKNPQEATSLSPTLWPHSLTGSLVPSILLRKCHSRGTCMVLLSPVSR